MTSKWLRSALCVFLLPLVLIFATPSTAAAARDAEKVSFTFDRTFYPDVNCQAIMTMEQGTGPGTLFYSVSVASMDCRVSGDSGMFGCTFPEASCVEAKMDVVDSGQSCGSISMDGYPGADDHKATQIHTIFSGGVVVAQDCDPTELCLTLTGDGEITTVCRESTLDPPVVAGAAGACADGSTMQQPVLQFFAELTNPEFGHSRVRERMQGSSYIAPASAARPTGGDGWHFYAVVDNHPAESPDVNGGTVPLGDYQYLVWTVSGTGGQTITLDNTRSTASGSTATFELASSKAAAIRIVGVGGYRKDGDVFHNAIPPVGSAPSPPPATQGPPVGVTSYDHCMFYWGEKLTDFTGTADNPIGPYMAGPPVDEPLPELDPPTETTPEPETEFDWLGLIWAALNAIKGVLGGVLSAVQALAGAIAGIASAILNGLEALFVPDVDSWGLEQLVDQLQAKPPFSLFEPLAEAATNVGTQYQSGGGCGVLADFSGGGVPITVTCADVRNSPGMDGLYQLVKFGLIALTGLAVFRMFAGYFQDGQ